MPSSAITRTPRSQFAVPLWLVVRGDDHPKACTGRRLVHQRVVRIARGALRGPGPIALDPYASTVLSGRDRTHAERFGILVVDCSWNRLSERGHFEEGESPSEVRRRLPFLLATNPQHFGRVGQLNSAEAFAAALAVLGHESEARALLAPFHGASSFFEVNAARMGRYRRAQSPRAMLAAERGAFSDL